jgi:hypothetical protein
MEAFDEGNDAKRDQASGGEAESQRRCGYEIGVVGQSDADGPERDCQCQERECLIEWGPRIPSQDIDAYAHIQQGNPSKRYGAGLDMKFHM